MNSSKISRFCDRFLEAGWLLGLTIAPVFFNVYSSRVFEPDKLTTLRALATVMAVLWLVRFLEEVLQQQKPVRFSLRTPMVIPTLVMMVVYVLSSILSLVPYTSFIGSYQRLQGTYTLFGYLVIFFALLTTLRTRAQLSRLMTVLILNSLPVALYGIIQHNGLDPLPWAGNVQTRVAANMGNAIFVAAYLIMIVPLTIARIVESFGDILRREEARASDILRASSYIFILAVQLLTIWYTRSRGPWLGLVAAFFLFPYLCFMLLQQQAVGEAAAEQSRTWYGDILKGLGIGLGTLVLAVALFGLSMLALPGQAGLYVGGGLAVLSFGGIWLYLIVERKGWRWLWIGWATVGLAMAVVLLAINLPGPLHDRAVEITSIRRMARIFEWESGTGRVRTLIWEGALEMIKPHEPLTFPDESWDTRNFLRPVIGYGPEAMYVGYNSFYPPLLGHYESRNASPDRSHNETLDSVVITGLLGLGSYLFVFGSVFYWGLRWLGIMHNRRQLWLYLGLFAVLSLALFIFFVTLERLYFFAVAIPLGLVLTLGLFLTWRAFQVTLRGRAALGAVTASHPHSVLLVAILTAVLAHFVEINFGISIAATRTTFWALVGMLVVLGLRWLPGETGAVLSSQVSPSEQEKERSASRRKRRVSKKRQRQAPDRRWLVGVLALSLAATFLLGTLAFDFITNSDRATSAGKIFWQSLTLLYAQRQTSYGGLMIFVFTWVLFGVVGLGELDRENLFHEERRKRWWMGIAVYSSISLVGLLLFGGVLASFHAQLPQIAVQTIEDVVDVALKLAGVLGHYYGLIFGVGVLMALVLMREEPEPRRWGEWVSLLVLPVLLLFSILLIRPYCYDLIRADVVFKQGTSFANSNDANQKQIGIAHFDTSIALAPREDYYRLFLGKAYLELAQTLPPEIDAAQRQAVFEETEEVLKEARQINPLNTDHSANLARFYRGWSAQVTEQELRASLLQKALENYETALMLSPHNATLWNELAILYAFEIGDQDAFQEAIAHSMDLDLEYEATWMTLGDVYYNIQHDIPDAIEAYQKALEITPRNCTVRYTLGTLQLQENRWENVIETLEPSFEYCANSSSLWDVYRMLAIARFYLGEPENALQLASQALQLAPEEQRAVVEQLIAAIQQPAPQVPVPAEP